MSTYFPAAVSLTDMPTGEGWENNSIMLKASESCGLWYEMKRKLSKEQTGTRKYKTRKPYRNDPALWLQQTSLQEDKGPKPFSYALGSQKDHLIWIRKQNEGSSH